MIAGGGGCLRVLSRGLARIRAGWSSRVLWCHSNSAVKMGNLNFFSSLMEEGEACGRRARLLYDSVQLQCPSPRGPYFVAKALRQKARVGFVTGTVEGINIFGFVQRCLVTSELSERASARRSRSAFSSAAVFSSIIAYFLEL